MVGDSSQFHDVYGKVAQASLREMLEALDQQLQTRTAAHIRTVPTGWEILDEVLGGGLHAGELLLLGGPPGVGKTITALQWARNIASAGHRVVYICYEHEPTTLLIRLLALETDQDGGERTASRALLEAMSAANATGRPLEETLSSTPGGTEALERMRSYSDNLIILRASGARTTLEDLRAHLESHLAPSDSVPTVAIVDYLQKIPMHPEPEFESEKVTRTIEGLKDIALELHIPLVVLSAVDRLGLEVRRIRMHHLRGSSAVSFESDVVVMLNDKHKAVSKVHLSYDTRAAQSFRDWVVFSVEKNREGPNLVDLEFRKDFRHFRFDPDGGLISERLVDERLDEHDL